MNQIGGTRLLFALDSSKHSWTKSTPQQRRKPPRSGRPPALSRLQKENILRSIWSNLKISYAVLKQEAGVDVHRNILYRMPKNEGITNWLAKKKTFIYSGNSRETIEMISKYQNWTGEDWYKIIFGDKRSHEKGTSARRLWVFRTPDQKWNKEMIQPYKKGKDINVMIWSAIHGNGRSDMMIIDRDSDSEKSGYIANSYPSVLRDQLPRIWQPGMTFMQNNPSIHIAKRVKQWLEDEGIMVLVWPLYSPDLNISGLDWSNEFKIIIPN